MVWPKSALCFLLCVPCFARAKDYTGYYDFRAPLSAEAAALAGATLASGQTSPTEIKNPAVLALQSSQLGFSLDSGKTHVRPGGELEKIGSKSGGMVLSIPTVLGPVGTGVSVSGIEAKDSFSVTGQNAIGFSSRDVEVRPAFAVRIFDELSIGMAGVYTLGHEEITQAQPDMTIEAQDFSGLAWRGSLLASLSSAKIAVAYQTEIALATKQTVVPRAGASLGKPYKPARFEMGASYAFAPFVAGALFPLQPTVFGEVDVIHFPSLGKGDSLKRGGSLVHNPVYFLYAPTESYATEPAELITEARIVPRMAARMELVRSEVSSVALLSGLWREPPQAVGEVNVWHTTGGCTVSFWGVEGQFGVDRTQSESRFHVGLGFDSRL